MSSLREHAILAFLWRKQWELWWNIFEKLKILRFPLSRLEINGAMSRYCETFRDLSALVSSSCALRFCRFLAGVVSQFASASQSARREGEKMKIRRECGGKRRAINGIRIDRAPRITCRYCVIAARTRAYETTRHAYARAYANVRRMTAHVAARRKWRCETVSHLFLYLLE